MVKTYYSILLFILTAFVFCSSAFANEQNIDVFNIATEGYLRPYNFTRPDGTLDGFEIELGQYVCAQMHVKCSFVAQPFDGIIAGLNAGKYDAIMGAITATAKREEIVDFSEPYSQAPLVFATMKGSEYENLPLTAERIYLPENPTIAARGISNVLAAMQGATIGVVTGTISDTLVNRYFKEAVRVREYKSVEPALLDLRAGRINMLAHSRAYLSSMQHTPGFEDLVMTGPYYKGALLGRGAGIVVRKGQSALIKKLNNALAAAKSDGTIKRLSKKWIGFDVTP